METVQGSQLLDMIGKMKAATVIIGILSLGFCAASYDSHSSSDEYALAMICIAFICSFCFVAAVLLGAIPITEVWRRIDMVYHLAMGCFLSLATLLMLVRLVSVSGESKGNMAERSFALIFNFISTCTYGFIGVGIYKTPAV